VRTEAGFDRQGALPSHFQDSFVSIIDQ